MVSIWIKEKMRQAREDKKLSVKNAAELLDVTPEYLSMLENGHRQPSQKLISKMSEIYEQPAIYFLAGEKNLAIV